MALNEAIHLAEDYIEKKKKYNTLLADQVYLLRCIVSLFEDVQQLEDELDKMKDDMKSIEDLLVG